jgi:DNA replication protein DnaC
MLLRSFCLATMAGQYEEVMRRAEQEGWSHRQVLRHLCEGEAVERAQKRTARLLAESGLPETKTLSTLNEAVLPAKVRRQLPALIEGGFVDRAVNVLAFGLPGRGKTHFLAALGRELILRHSKKVLFRPTFKLVAQLLAVARRGNDVSFFRDKRWGYVGGGRGGIGDIRFKSGV